MVAFGDCQTMTHAAAAKRLSDNGITLSSSGNCFDKNNPSCTSLDGIRANTISQVIGFKQVSGCQLVVTGGTETGHGGRSRYSHANGYKIDYRLNDCIKQYVEQNMAKMRRRSDGALQWSSNSGNTYALESNHWDVTYK